jgi:hypothetical protein
MQLDSFAAASSLTGMGVCRCVSWSSSSPAMLLQSDPAVFAAEAERLLTSSRVSTVLGGFSSASRRGQSAHPGSVRAICSLLAPRSC